MLCKMSSSYDNSFGTSGTCDKQICFLHVLKRIGVGWGFENPCTYPKKISNAAYVNRQPSKNV